MNKLNRDIINIIFKYIKPLCYLKELEESIKYIKYDYIMYIKLYYIHNCIIRDNTRWMRDYTSILDYRLNYLQNKQYI
jgi:hypothetical protein